eukprot:SAG22_NODE_411_length_10900_cov_2.633738_4_plen_217_part_00
MARDSISRPLDFRHASRWAKKQLQHAVVAHRLDWTSVQAPPLAAGMGGKKRAAATEAAAKMAKAAATHDGNPLARGRPAATPRPRSAPRSSSRASARQTPMVTPRVPVASPFRAAQLVRLTAGYKAHLASLARAPGRGGLQQSRPLIQIAARDDERDRTKASTREQRKQRGTPPCKQSSGLSKSQLGRLAAARAARKQLLENPPPEPKAAAPLKPG